MRISEVHNIDCLEYMRTIPDKFFELAVVDPPYGIKADNMTMGSGKHKFIKNKNWDSGIPDNKYFNELFRISQNQIIWGGNYFTKYLHPSPHWLIWDKLNPNLSFAECELAWLGSGKNTRIFRHYSARVENNGKIHPTQKPVALYKWILQNYAQLGDKIFDSHMGSQSSRIAAWDMGFDYYGCELDADYFRDGCKRFENHRSQLRIDIPIVKLEPEQNKLF